MVVFVAQILASERLDWLTVFGLLVVNLLFRVMLLISDILKQFHYWNINILFSRQVCWLVPYFFHWSLLTKFNDLVKLCLYIIMAKNSVNFTFVVKVLLYVYLISSRICSERSQNVSTSC